MPKKPPKNAFFYYMLDYEQTQRKKGVTYADRNELSLAAGAIWPSLEQSVRAKFEAMAKNEKAKLNAACGKLTSQGVPVAYIEAMERERSNAVKAERQDIMNFVKQKSIDESIKDEDLFVIDVNSYCKAGDSHLIGEFTVLRFSLRDGIKDSYHEIVQPGGIPIGYAFDVKLNCKELGLDMPDEDGPRSNYIQILATIVDFLRQSAPPHAPLPPLYTLPDKVAPVLDFLQQLCSPAAEDESRFRVYRLDTLLYHLAQCAPRQPDQGFPKESLALAILKKDEFKYSPGLACDFHEAGEKSLECTSARVKRWAYTVFDSCLPLHAIAPHPGQHYPADFHLDSILTYKEERRAAGPVSRVARPVDQDSSCSSLPDSRNDSSRVVDKKRVYVPLRKPTTDYSQAVRMAPDIAPLSETDFPSMSSSSGRGRGRNITSSFDKLKM